MGSREFAVVAKNHAVGRIRLSGPDAKHCTGPRGHVVEREGKASRPKIDHPLPGVRAEGASADSLYDF